MGEQRENGKKSVGSMHSYPNQILSLIEMSAYVRRGCRHLCDNRKQENPLMFSVRMLKRPLLNAD